MGAPKEVAESESQRIEWVRKQLLGMSPEQRRKFSQEAFGQGYATYVTEYFTEPVSPETEKAISYARSEQAAKEERDRVLAVRGTAEGIIESAKGAAGQLELLVQEEEKQETAIREVGKAYLNYLRRRDRITYEKIKLLKLPEEMEYDWAAEELWRRSQPKPEPIKVPYGPEKPGFTLVTPPTEWDRLDKERRITELNEALQELMKEESAGGVKTQPQKPEGTAGTPEQAPVKAVTKVTPAEPVTIAAEAEVEPTEVEAPVKAVAKVTPAEVQVGPEGDIATAGTGWRHGVSNVGRTTQGSGLLVAGSLA
jgi:hypothetical protein